MELRESIINKLLQNKTLLMYLAKNIATWEKEKVAKKNSSVIHVGRLTQDLITPFLTVDFGEDARVNGDLDVEFYGEFMYIRAYISKGSGYMKAVKMLREVYNSLHDADIQCDYETIVKLSHIATGADLYDEGVGKEYKQATYRIYKLI